MKKCIFSILCCLVSFQIQAATMSWYLWVDVPEYCYKQNGCIAYVFVGDEATKANVLESIQNGSFNAGNARDKGIVSWGWTQGEKRLNADFGTSVQAFAVVFDSTRYQDANNFVISDIEVVMSDYGPMNYYFENFGSWTAVPEPCTGLLMFVGAALFLLRRKALY